MVSVAEKELMAVATEWDRVMVTNDAAAIGRFMTDDWVIVGSDGRLVDKHAFLADVETGKLTHDVMESSEFHIRVYGDAAVVIVRGVSSGHFDGMAFREVERSSNVFVRRDGQWRCVLTHLSRLNDA